MQEIIRWLTALAALGFAIMIYSVYIATLHVK